jgi:hypothetical protein
VLTAFDRLEVFNSVILHNLSENQNLIYGILTAHKSFEDLGTFTLSRGLREIKRVQLAKEELARKSEGNPKSKGTSDSTGEEEEPHDEKARLLENEGSGALGRLGETDSTENVNLPQEQEVSTTQPIASTTSEGTASPSDGAPSFSEKARGKMKARRSISLDTASSLDLVAAAGVGRNGFVPTQEWVRFLPAMLSFHGT